MVARWNDSVSTHALSLLGAAVYRATRDSETEDLSFDWEEQGALHLGYTAEELTNSLLLSRLFGPTYDEWLSRLRQAFETPAPYTWQHPLSITGHDCWVRHTLVRDSAEDVLGVLQIVLPATPAEWNGSRRPKGVEPLAKSRSEFLSTLSHELRTPMNAILGMSYLVLKSNLSPKQHDYVSRIQSAASSLRVVVEDILDFSMIEAGALELEAVPFRIDELMVNLASLFRPALAEKGLRLVLSVAPDVPDELVGDPSRLSRVLCALMDNAVKFTESGEILLGCRIAESSDSALTLRFSVSDTGIGISAGQQHELFSPFVQGDGSASRKYSGAGLGLAIVKMLVERMQGGVTVHSDPGHGTEVSFTSVFRRGSPSSPRTLACPEVADLQVLALCDHESGCKVIADLLSDFGACITETSDGERAVEHLTHLSLTDTPCQLVVVDLFLSDEALDALLGRLRGATPAPPPVIVLTNKESHAGPASFLFHHAETVLLKPVLRRTMFDAIVRTLRKDETTSPASSLNTSGVPFPYLEGFGIETALPRFSGRHADYIAELQRFLDEKHTIGMDIEAHVSQGRFEEARKMVRALYRQADHLAHRELLLAAERLEQVLSRAQRASPWEEVDTAAPLAHFLSVLETVFQVLGTAFQPPSTPEAEKAPFVTPSARGSSGEVQKQAASETMEAELSRLEHMLENSDAEASEAFDNVSAHLYAQAPETSRQLKGALENFDYDYALVLLGHLKNGNQI